MADDCSSDNSWDILQRVSTGQNSRFQLFRQKHRLGWVDNTNFLLRHIDSDFFFLCYHDDILESSYVEALIMALRKSEAVGAYGDVHLTKLDGTEEQIRYDNLAGITNPVTRATSIINREGKAWVTNRGIFRTSALKVVGGLRKNLEGEYSAAYPWILGMALEGQFLRVPEVLCRKIKYANGVSSHWMNGHRQNFAMTIDMIESIWRSSLSTQQQDTLLRAVLGKAGSFVPPAK